MRCRWLPENSWGKRFACSGLKPTVRNRPSTLRRPSLPRYRPWIRSGSATISRTVILGLSRRVAEDDLDVATYRPHLLPLEVVMSVPLKTILPSVGS